MEQSVIAVLLGASVGMILGLTGAGGSIFAVPLLVIGLGWNLTQAAPIALLAVCAASVFGTMAGWSNGQVCKRAAVFIGVFGSMTASLGVTLAAHAPHTALVALFAAVMILVAFNMLLSTRQFSGNDLAGETEPGSAVCRVDMSSSRIILNNPCKFALALSGAFTGVISGALGVGAGFVIVPTLRAVTELSVRSSIATSLMAIAIVSAGAVAAFVLHGQTLPLVVAAPFLAGALAGMFIGRRLAPRIAGPRLQQLFALFMLVAAVIMVWREFVAG